VGYVLLWFENLAVALLLLATVLACLGRWQWKRTRVALAVVFALVILVPYAGLAGLVGYLKFALGLTSFWFYPLLALTASFFVGAGWILIAGLRRGEAGLSGPQSAAWPRGRLAIALGVVLALHLMTVWNLDLAMRQRLGTLRAEAGALALSVAPARPPDRDNAALLYQQAFQAMGDPAAWPKAYGEKWYKWLDPAATESDFKDAELRAFLKRQAPALALLHEAADKPGCYFERDYGRPSFSMLLPELQKIREAARLLAFDARAKAATGEVRAALGDCRVMLAMAEHASSDPNLIALLVAAAIDRMTMQTLEAVLASTPPAADDLKAVFLDGNFSYHLAFRRALRMEEAFGLAAFYDLTVEKIPFSELGLAPPEQSSSSPAILGCAPLYRWFWLATDQELYRRQMKQWQQWASRPYWESKAYWDEWDALAKLLDDRLNCESKADWDRCEGSIRDGAGVLTRQLLGAPCRGAETTAQADARRDLMRLGLATYRFQASHGRLPAKPDELVPEFIPAVPQDPFDGKPLRMKKTARGLVLYSIGPDMTDNGGAPFDPATRTGDITFTVVEKAAQTRGARD
jgi:hypothetical protein